MNELKLLHITSSLIIMILSLSVHEYAHALVAWWLGDDTAEREGRLTLDPRSHVDPIGTLLMPVIGAYSGIPLIAWARPVPTMPVRYTRRFFGRRITMGAGMVLVAIAGPLANLLLVVLLTVGTGLALRFASVDDAASHMIGAAIMMNLGLFIFNLIPIPPLDGSRVVAWLLPRRLQDRYAMMGGLPGFVALMVLIQTGVVGTLTEPFYGVIGTTIGFFAGAP